MHETTILIEILLILLLIMASTSSIVNWRSKIILDKKYIEVAVATIPSETGTIFGYNGRVFSIESFPLTIEGKRKSPISDEDIFVIAYKILESKQYLNNNMQKPIYYMNTYDVVKTICNEMEEFSQNKENNGLYVTNNRVAKKRIAPFFITSSDGRDYYLITL